MKMESRGKAGKAGTSVKELETIRGEGGEKSGRVEDGRKAAAGARYSMKLEAVCYIQRVRIFSLLANVTN